MKLKRTDEYSLTESEMKAAIILYVEAKHNWTPDVDNISFGAFVDVEEGTVKDFSAHFKFCVEKTID